MMRRWLRDRPWIWILLFMTVLMAGSVATLVIAELNRPVVVRQSGAMATDGRSGDRSTGAGDPDF